MGSLSAVAVPLTNSGPARVNKKLFGKDADASICTASGKIVNPLALDLAEICPDDIAHALSQQCRFSGHTSSFYSVAEHCVRVARWVKERGGSPEDEQWGLLHDASEAYLVDIPRPLKADPNFGRTYRGAENRATAIVAERFGLDNKIPPIVHDGDVALFTAERRDLMPKSDIWDLWSAPPELDVPQDKIIAWTPGRAKKEWLNTFVRLFGAHA